MECNLRGCAHCWPCDHGGGGGAHARVEPYTKRSSTLKLAAGEAGPAQAPRPPAHNTRQSSTNAARSLACPGIASTAASSLGAFTSRVHISSDSGPFAPLDIGWSCSPIALFCSGGATGAHITLP